MWIVKWFKIVVNIVNMIVLIIDTWHHLHWSLDRVLKGDMNTCVQALVQLHLNLEGSLLTSNYETNTPVITTF